LYWKWVRLRHGLLTLNVNVIDSALYTYNIPWRRVWWMKCSVIPHTSADRSLLLLPCLSLTNMERESYIYIPLVGLDFTCEFQQVCRKYARLSPAFWSWTNLPSVCPLLVHRTVSFMMEFDIRILHIENNRKQNQYNLNYMNPDKILFTMN